MGAAVMAVILVALMTARRPNFVAEPGVTQSTTNTIGPPK